MATVQPKMYYEILDAQDKMIIAPAKENVKPMAKHGAITALQSLHQALTSNREIVNQSALEVSQIASLIFINFEQKYSMLGRIWDNLKQLFYLKTERAEITKFYQEIVTRCTEPKTLSEAEKITSFYKKELDAAFTEFSWSLPTLEPLEKVSDELINDYMSCMLQTCKSLSARAKIKFIDLSQDSGFAKAKKMHDWFGQNESKFHNHFNLDEQDNFQKWARYLFLSFATNFILQNELVQAREALKQAQAYSYGLITHGTARSELLSQLAFAHLRINDIDAALDVAGDPGHSLRYMKVLIAFKLIREGQMERAVKLASSLPAAAGADNSKQKINELIVMAYIAQGKLEEALKHAGNSTSTVTMSRYIMAIAKIHLAEDNLQKAYEAICKISSDLILKYSMCYQIARLHMKNKQFKEALKVLLETPTGQIRDAILFQLIDAILLKNEGKGLARQAALEISQHDQKLSEQMLARTNPLLLL